VTNSVIRYREVVTYHTERTGLCGLLHIMFC